MCLVPDILVEPKRTWFIPETTIFTPKPACVDLQFSSEDLTLTIDDFNTRIISPAVLQIADEIDQRMVDTVWRMYDFKIGDTLLIRKPPRYEVNPARLTQGVH